MPESPQSPDHPACLWTIGHSNRSLADFLEMLATASMECVADVRRFPGSRKHPHFGQEALRSSLASVGIAYRHIVGLGGRRRRSREPSPNTGWRVEAFNAYADFMATTEFEQSLEQLQQTAREFRTAIMCSEALPWQCHRRLIADALVVRGWEVEHLMAGRRRHLHTLTEFAQQDGSQLTYPAS